MLKMSRRCPNQTEQAIAKHSRYEAFVVVLMSPGAGGGRPDDEAYYAYSDHFYHCIDADVCGCPLAAPSQRWKVDYLRPGERFHGRLAGLSRDGDPLPSKGWAEDFELNCIPVGSVPRPLSCYAVITPDGLWHECFEAERRDLVIGDACGRPVPRAPEADTLSKLQVAWRYEVEHLLQRHADCWALGCTAYLRFDGLWRWCDYDHRPAAEGP